MQTLSGEAGGPARARELGTLKSNQNRKLSVMAIEICESMVKHVRKVVVKYVRKGFHEFPLSISRFIEQRKAPGEALRQQRSGQDFLEALGVFDWSV